MGYVLSLTQLEFGINLSSIIIRNLNSLISHVLKKNYWNLYMPKCKYCNHEVEWWPGALIVETSDGTEIMHEECYQFSGDDNGLVAEIHEREDWV